MRNDPYARRAIAALVANAIGTGITADSTSPAGAVWKQWAKECDYYGELDFYGLQALVARCVFESGECLIVRQRGSAADAGLSGVSLKLKVMEPDFLDANKHGPVGNGNYAIGGIEVDPQGRRVAYWLWQQHPGDQPIFVSAMKSVRTVAEDVIHLYEKERPGQLRGVPRLASVVLQLRDMNEYNEAILVKKKVEACFAAFVTTDEENRLIAPGAVTSSESASDGSSYNQRVESLAPGMIQYLKPGENVEFGNPSSVAGTNEFSQGHLRAAAMGAGVTYEILTGDLSNTNFSSMRAGRQEFKAMIEQFRWLTFIPGFCARVQDWFEEAAFMAGKVRTRGYDFTWTPPRWEYVNPLEDVKTDKEELSAGLSSWSAQVRKRGEDPIKVLDEIKKDKAAFESAGIDFNFGVGAESASKNPGTIDNPKDAPAAPPPTPTKPTRELTIEDVRHELERSKIADGLVALKHEAGKADAYRLGMAAREAPPPVVNNTINIPERSINVAAPSVTVPITLPAAKTVTQTVKGERQPDGTLLATVIKETTHES